MRDNWNISITGNGIILVPYKRKFVENYHNWMKDPFLLESTASEELPIEEEYAMQKLWQVDPKKCTFIILATVQDTTGDESASASMGVSELDRMVGDVNLFMNDYDDSKNAEIEIMIAEPRYRRCGLAREALKLMIHYGINQLKLTRFFAKIGEKNVASIELFKSLSFREINYVEAFKEYEYELLPCSEEITSMINEWGSHASINPYNNNEDDDDEEEE